MSFYRIYRPQVIEEIDNTAVRTRLLELLTKDKKKLPHAYLFTGPRGTGKTTAARLIAKLFNCTKPRKSGPCGTCEQCRTISEGRNLDVLEIDAASNRGIDEIRALRDAINLTPSSGAYKVYIIDEVHMLTTEAFNALLKTLEEPPAHAIFVLATTDPQKVPATIKSRCTPISFHRASSEELLSALKRIVKAEKISIDDQALLLLAETADGSFRDAVKMLEQVSFHKGKITQDVVRAGIALTDEPLIGKFLATLKTKNAEASLTIIEKLVKDGVDIKTFMTDCLRHLEQTLIDTTIAKSTDSAEEQDLVYLINKMTDAYGQLKISPIPQLPLELAVVDFCTHETGTISQRTTTITAAPPFTKPIQTIPKDDSSGPSLGLLTLEKLTEHWADFIAELKPYNHSVAGVMRSARPKSVSRGIVTIEAFYPFHKDKLSESKTKDILVMILKKLFGEKVKVEIILGKK